MVDWLYFLFFSMPIYTVIWLLGMWSTWKDNKLYLMNKEVDRIWKNYTFDMLPLGIEFGVGMFDDIMKTCWENKWKPSKFIKLFDKKFSGIQKKT